MSLLYVNVRTSSPIDEQTPAERGGILSKERVFEKEYFALSAIFVGASFDLDNLWIKKQVAPLPIEAAAFSNKLPQKNLPSCRLHAKYGGKG
ncbi:MAG TPA: hypothetical protein P5287_04730 [bacterium]|nr:hypothetical protein [bacterium]